MQEPFELTARCGEMLIIGGGKMGTAILSGLIDSQAADPAKVTVANPGQAKRDLIAQRYPVRCVPDACDACPAQTVILAVSPRVMRDVVAKASEDGVFSECRLVISVAAGITTSTLEQLLPSDVAVVRVMPNMPLSIGSGCSGIAAGSRADDGQVAIAQAIFQASGDTVLVDEGLIGVVTALSGSGPAYFAMLVDDMAKAGVDAGMPYEQAYRLALSTMAGTADYLRSGAIDAGELVSAISTPGGTTVAALEAMRRGGFEQAVNDGVLAAARRAEELAG